MYSQGINEKELTKREKFQSKYVAFTKLKMQTEFHSNRSQKILLSIVWRTHLYCQSHSPQCHRRLPLTNLYNIQSYGGICVYMKPNSWVQNKENIGLDRIIKSLHILHRPQTNSIYINFRLSFAVNGQLGICH